MVISRMRSPAAAAAAGSLALTTGLALTAPASAIPPNPSSPDDDGVVGVRPTFSWTAGGPAGVLRYEVLVDLAQGQVEVAEVASPALSAVSQLDLPDDSRLRWSVRAVGPISSEETAVAARRHIRVATSPGPPVIVTAPPPITRTASPLFAWAGGRFSSRWTVVNAPGVAVQSGEVLNASGQVAPGPLPDGSYQFRVLQRNLVGVEGPPASVGFSIDTTAPGALGLRRSTAKPSSRNTPVYSWSGQERGATVTWRILRTSGAPIAGPATTTAGIARPSSLGVGSYVFEALQTDLAGNAGPPRIDPFVVLPRLAAGVKLPMRNVGRLRPAVGATVPAVRPTLRWTGGPKGTRAYNVQVFRVANGSTLRKVVSAFPHARRYLLPRRATLTRGRCYVWRVWPFKGARPAPTPLGVSHFCVRPK